MSSLKHMVYFQRMVYFQKNMAYFQQIEFQKM